MKPVVIIGAGRTGRGLVPLLLADAALCFVDADAATVAALRGAGAYGIRSLDGRDTMHRIEPVLVAHSDDSSWHRSQDHNTISGAGDLIKKKGFQNCSLEMFKVQRTVRHIG